MMTEPLLPLGHFLVFDALYEHRSVGKAARSLSMPQPTFSRWLGQLRKHFNDPLFVRTHSGMEPTPVATQAAEPIAQIIAIYRKRIKKEAAFDPATSTRDFRLATSDFGQILFFPLLHQQFAIAAPHLRITGVALGRQLLAHQLEQGTVDLAIGGFPALSAGIKAQTLFHEKYACVVRRDHPVLGRPFDLDAFRRSSHIIVAAHEFSHVHEDVEAKLLALCPAENIRIVTESFLVGALLAETTDVVLTVPARLGEWFAHRGNLVVLPVPVDLPTIDVKQYWHERYDRDAGNVWLRRVVSSQDFSKRD